MRLGQRPRRWGWWGVVVGLSFLCLSGCSSGGRYPVHGKVVYADSEQPVKELAGLEVIFTSEQLHISARGTVQKDGSFQLGTDRADDGTPPGEYVVTLTQPVREPERPYVGDRVVDRAYEDPGTSDLKAEVKPQKNDFVFKLRRIDKPRK